MAAMRNAFHGGPVGEAPRAGAAGRRRRGAAAAALACAVVATGLVSRADEPFVRRAGTHFLSGDQRFYFMGANCFYLAYFAQDTAAATNGQTWRAMADEVMERSRTLGLRVLRIWAFNESPDLAFEGNPHGEWWLRTVEDGTARYREEALAGFDYVLERARSLGLYVILTLANNWSDYGGKRWYVVNSPTAWNDGAEYDAFYTDGQCRQWYKEHVLRMANRTNTWNGRVYKDDPTIFAWQLMNEPRCKTDTTGVTIRNWIFEMAAWVKAADTNHMVSTGEEGWTDAQPWEGTRWHTNNACPDVDYTVAHCWPDSWSWLWGDPAQTAGYSNAMAWVRDHARDAGTVLGKPFVLSEYGRNLPAEGAYGRDAYMAGWFDEILASAAGGGAAAGLNFWMFEADHSGHADLGSVFSRQTSTVELVSMEAEAMNTLIAPRIDPMTALPEGIRLTWSSVVGHPQYRVRVSGDLVAWKEPALVATNEWTDTEAAGLSRRFYRIVPRY